MRESSPEYQLGQSRVLREGTRIGPDLTVVSVLGEGGTGVVYLAQHGVLKRQVAVKMSNVTGPRAEDAKARLIREARMCASIRDPHVPRIYALAELEDGTPYIVMEKAEGLTLSHLLSERQLGVREACLLACELLDALHAVHRKGIVHRDIKPSNLMVHFDEDGLRRLCLLDFGVGKVLSSAELDLPALTCRGELLGTPLYMAPEQILAQPVDARADVYSVGVVLYEMLSGRTPFEGNSVGAVFAAVLRDEMTPLASLCPDLPAGLLAVVRKATAKQAEHRFADAAAMRKALGLSLGDVEGSVRTPDSRHRALSLSLARTVRIVPKDESGEPSRVFKVRARFGYRAARDAIAVEPTLAEPAPARAAT